MSNKSGLILLPLMNTPFRPGQCRATVEAMGGPLRDIAWAEYHYFSGHPEEAAKAAGQYLTARTLDCACPPACFMPMPISPSTDPARPVCPG